LGWIGVLLDHVYINVTPAYVLKVAARLDIASFGGPCDGLPEGKMSHKGSLCKLAIVLCVVANWLPSCFSYTSPPVLVCCHLFWFVAQAALTPAKPKWQPGTRQVGSDNFFCVYRAEGPCHGHTCVATSTEHMHTCMHDLNQSH
jgi:hypothetical protein